MTTENTQIIVLTNDQITDRVNRSNKFNKEEITIHRTEITAARKERRESLKAMKASDVNNLIGKHMEQGFYVQKSEPRSMKTGDKITVEFFRPNAQAAKSKALSEMSVEEIVAGLGANAAKVMQALIAKGAGEASIEA